MASILLQQASLSYGENVSCYYGEVTSFISLELPILSTLLVFKECEFFSFRKGLLSSPLAEEISMNVFCCLILFPLIHFLNFKII